MKFDLSGERFFMVTEDKVGVHEAEDARLLFELENPKQKRVLCAAPGEVCWGSCALSVRFWFGVLSLLTLNIGFWCLLICCSISDIH